MLRLSHCQIIDDRGPVKAIGVNYVDGFWRYAVDGDRQKYLPYLDALAKAKIPFIRMAFGPWAAYKPDGPPEPQIADFVLNQSRYFQRLNTFLNDLRARHIGAVLNVFWGEDPYTVFFREPRNASSELSTRTHNFLSKVVSELGRSHGSDPEIWLIEFTNEGNLAADFPQAPHSRTQEVALAAELAVDLRAARDRHLISSGNSLPRPSAQHLAEHHGWTSDTLQDFFEALDSETANETDVVSVHIYAEGKTDRPWDGGDILGTLPELMRHSKDTCRPIFVGEFGNTDLGLEDAYVLGLVQSGVQMSAIWAFARGQKDPFDIDISEQSIARLSWITKLSHN